MIKVKLLPGGMIPTKAHDDDAGFDLYTPDYLDIQPGCRVMVDLKACFEIPTGYFGKIEDRSSLARRGVHSSGGVIDAGYRNSVSVLLRNDSKDVERFNPGDRIAQMLILPVPPFKIEQVTELSESIRGVKGFGSSGR